MSIKYKTIHHKGVALHPATAFTGGYELRKHIKESATQLGRAYEILLTWTNYGFFRYAVYEFSQISKSDIRCIRQFVELMKERGATKNTHIYT